MSLPDGNSLYVIIKDGVALLPTPELAKILPVVGWTAMKQIRNFYSISVERVREMEGDKGLWHIVHYKCFIYDILRGVVIVMPHV